MKHNLKPAENNQANTCHEIDGNQHLSKFDFNVTERVVLEIIRLICANYASPTNDCWDEAQRRARALWTHFNPHLLVGAVAGMTRAIQTNRRASFGYMSATCSHCREYICPDEIDLLRVLRAACQKDATKLLSTAMMLAASKNPHHIIRAAHHVATFMTACPEQPDYSFHNLQTTPQKTLH